MKILIPRLNLFSGHKATTSAKCCLIEFVAPLQQICHLRKLVNPALLQQICRHRELVIPHCCSKHAAFGREGSHVIRELPKNTLNKDWNRNRKEDLITAFNPGWKFLNKELFGKWPPDNLFHRKDSYLE
jgi:hypothetical protein